MRALLVLSLVSLSACGWENVALAAHGRFEKTASIEASGTFHLENVNGRVTVEPWSQNEVRIEAEKSASSEGYLQEIKIDVQGEGNRVDVKTRFPRDGIFGSGGHGRVDYLIRLPAGVRVEVRTVNGEVQVEAIDGAVQASTVNGTVRVTDAAGAVDASTVNGNIRAGYRRLAQSGHHSYTTVNGSVTLYLPSEVG